MSPDFNGKSILAGKLSHLNNVDDSYIIFIDNDIVNTGIPILSSKWYNNQLWCALSKAAGQ